MEFAYAFICHAWTKILCFKIPIQPILSGCPKSAAEPVSSLLRRHLRFPPPPAQQVPNNPISTQNPSAPASCTCWHARQRCACALQRPHLVSKGPISFPNRNGDFCVPSTGLCPLPRDSVSLPFDQTRHLQDARRKKNVEHHVQNY